MRGEHLSDLLQRAGGLTDQAYPYGTVFLRRSAAAREQDAFRREAGEIEDALLVAISRRTSGQQSNNISSDLFTSVQSYVLEIKSQPALGRITISADPAVLAANPQLDPLLEPGDVIYVPQRPTRFRCWVKCCNREAFHSVRTWPRRTISLWRAVTGSSRMICRSS